MISDAELGYLAGVVDALAHLGVRDASGRQLAQLTVSTADAQLAQHCAALTGVSVTTVRRDYRRLGCSAHCEEPHLHVISTTARWQLVGARAVVVLRAVRPMLWVKSERVDDLLAAVGDAPTKSATMTKMRELGWAS